MLYEEMRLVASINSLSLSIVGVVRGTERLKGNFMSFAFGGKMRSY